MCIYPGILREVLILIGGRGGGEGGGHVLVINSMLHYI